MAMECECTWATYAMFQFMRAFITLTIYFTREDEAAYAMLHTSINVKSIPKPKED